jgi:hypothetical protein
MNLKTVLRIVSTKSVKKKKIKNPKKLERQGWDREVEGFQKLIEIVRCFESF